MARSEAYLRFMLSNLRRLREAQGLSPAEVEDRLILGPGWISRFEEGESLPSLDMLIAILQVMDKSLEDLLEGLPACDRKIQFKRQVYAEEEKSSLAVHFKYAEYDALYKMPRGKKTDFDAVIKTLRDGLSRLSHGGDVAFEAIKTDSVAKAFLHATRVWPHVNPSDLWWFVIYRAYCDPFNHPAQFARLDFVQSWKRTGGWALEEVLVRHYAPYLKKKGIRLFIPSGKEKSRLLGTISVADRLEPDKVDVLLTGRTGGHEGFFGVVHVKASFAERRTDDVPMSRSLVQAGYISPLWTMDCKSMPCAIPYNKGELGVSGGGGAERRSAKRMDIEADGYFSACFSYNSNTIPTTSKMKAKSRIYVCDFRNPDDAFSRFLVEKWKTFSQARRS
jgi:transcriptional regulator with XRE-family HTH domain